MLVVLMCVMLAADEPAVGEQRPTAEQIQFFETNVRPLLAEQCFKCHGDKKQWGGLRLDSREALLRGGDSGEAIVPGEPDKSLLIRAVRQVDDDLKMPKDDKLTARQVAALVRWVEMGAPFPATAGAAERTRDPKHWAFLPLAEPSVPVVTNSKWPHSALDHFILARLEAAGLSSTMRADKRTLIRRVTFDLTGLPPTPDEIGAYFADESPDAFARIVDRLLASPRYGERWGRHWLDVARYADSNGFDENVAQGNAWRYRDYVVAAFNRDKPFDRFVVEQLAGDLMPFNGETQQHEQLIATGFLSIGPKVLAETDQAKMRMDIIDEQLDTLGRAFLGLTLGCARCHDHKFDPIATADYYALAGIFKSTLTMRKYVKVAEWHEHLLPSAKATAMKTEFEANVAAKKTAIAECVADTEKDKLKKLRDELAALEKAGPELPSAMGVTEDKVTDIAIHVRGNPLELGDIVPRRTPPVLRGPRVPPFTDQESGRRQLAEWLVDPRHPLTARVFVNRVWRWHFGNGLVRTTDNFGLLGEAPSHPELLDWLARRFIADGWSVKSLHRLILNSSTYQQASAPTAETVSNDPENHLFSRAEVRRLEAEAVRDALLATSGQLDETMGGSLLKLKNRAYFFDHTSKDLTTYDSRRRSLYLPIVRNNVFDLFQLLDFPDPAVSTGNRATTVVASQALLMLNSDFVMQAATDFADRLLSDSPDDDQRLARLYVIAFGREPTADERQADRAFLAKVAQVESTESDTDQRQRQAWATLCHVALAANEFIYVK
ncbi:MAG: PSD1 and planctomycete cytochrome C domain-containing protein [Planctomycetota bacterium]|nr:PSD1 and planctomycete cytochrome C domain-containing protein [Planctomycetota bacterium]